MIQVYILINLKIYWVFQKKKIEFLCVEKIGWFDKQVWYINWLSLFQPIKIDELNSVQLSQQFGWVNWTVNKID